MSTETNSNAPDRLAISALELAEKIGVSERHVWALHSSGRLGPLPHRFGRAVRWSVDELRAWLAAGSPERSKWLAMRERGQA